MDRLFQEIALFAPAVVFNIYFAAASIPLGFVFAVALALGKASPNPLISRLSRGYIYAFRGSPLFIQFFMLYSLALSFNVSLWKPWGISWFVLHPLFIGPLVLTLNTGAYTAESSTPELLAREVKDSYDRWGSLVKKIGLQKQ